jgi:hypothetical protein
MDACLVKQSILFIGLACGFLAACDANTTGLSSDDSSNVAGITSTAPTLKPGVDSAIFLPVLVAGYHPNAEELATAGKACSSAADCATGEGQVVFHCSAPNHGQAQCQGVFPAGDSVVPGVAPSCAYYDCDSGYACNANAETHSVACVSARNKQTGTDG